MSKRNWTHAEIILKTDLLTMGLRATFGAALLMATVGLIHTTQQPCPNAVRMNEIAQEVKMIRLAMRGLMRECSTEDIYDEQCTCPPTPQVYYVAVTSEGGNDRKTRAEARNLNATTSLFSLDGEPISGAPNFRRGLNFVIIDRSTKNFTDSKSFNLLSDNSLQDDIVNYIDNVVPTDSVILMNVFDSATGGKIGIYKNLWLSLSRVGLVKRFTAQDSFAMVGFKAEPGICDRVPSFITETYKKNPSPNGRGGAWTEPASAVAQIPVRCDPYPRNIDFEVEVVSECWNQGVEYKIDGEDSPSLFLINNERILGTTWWQGLNVVVLDASYRTAKIAKHFSMAKASHETAFVEFINQQEPGTVVLVTVWETVGTHCKDDCHEALRKLGATFIRPVQGTEYEIEDKDNFCLIGYTGQCPNGGKPEWVTEKYYPNAGTSRGDKRNVVSRARAAVTWPLCG